MNNPRTLFCMVVSMAMFGALIGIVVASNAPQPDTTTEMADHLASLIKLER
jgi:hypothetical protein